MHVYTFESAPNPRRLTLFMAYKGIELPTTHINMRDGEHLGEDFQAINPQGTLPALKTDEGVLLTEVIGICSYLEAHFPDKPLLGTTPLERALVISWDHRIYVSLMEAFAEMLRNHSAAFANRAIPGPIDVEQIPALVDRGRHRFSESLKLFDAELGDQPFFCGENVSIADIDMLVVLDVASWVKESLPDECANIRRWLPQVRATLGIAEG